MMDKKINVVAVVGPTASGKTALAVELAKALSGEVVSADSMQIYKRMDIATAKPTAQEMSGVPHHLIDFLEPEESFSVARYCELAHAVIRDIHERGKLPIIAGGTGLYIDSLLENTAFEEQDIDPGIRARINSELEEKGIDALLEEIKGCDPQSYERLRIGRNPRRIARCLEVCRSTGMTQTELNERQRGEGSVYNAVKLGLTASDRAYLYDRIDRRVDIMIENGLLEEARSFYARNTGETAAAAIGYKELLPYLSGELSLDECVESLKRSTRRYAKRQLTWFNRDPDIRWYRIDEQPLTGIVSDAVLYIKDAFEGSL